MTHNSGLLSRDVTHDVVRLIESNLSDSFKDRYLRETLLSKFADPSPQLAKAREKAAVDKWLLTEERNAGTNLRLFIDDEDKRIGGFSLMRVLDNAASIIKKVIGTRVPMEALMGSFSGGASTSMRRKPGIVARKFSERLDVTQEAWDIVWPFIYKDHALWLELNPEVLNPRFVDSNVMFTVPKNDTIDRVACKEPDLNMYIQKAAGDFIRKRLKRVGIDLNDQTRNQELAHLGSVTGKLATVDLSSASDSITTQLVCRLLSTDWFHFLNSIRCKRTQLIDGSMHENEMFSSMGNGFTFELESLIFYGLTKALDRLTRTHGTISVYGDDIIMSSSFYGLLVHVFNYVGFKVNVSKSFAKGPFRESCGKHYYSGVDVTPFYIKRPVQTYPDIIRILNQLRRWCSDGSWCSSAWWSVWLQLSKHVPNRKLFGGWDLSSTETVVSYDGPAYRFMRVSDHRRPAKFEIGLYLEWQSNARKPLIVTERESSVVYEKDTYRVVKPRKHFAFNFGLSGPAFPQELTGATD